MKDKTSIEDVLKEINPKKEKKRFNKKNFNKLLTALANDPEFEIHVPVAKHHGQVLKTILPTKEFRKWCKKLLEKVGMDSKEASKVLNPDFTFDNMNGLYEFFNTAIYLYIENNNRFDLIPREDFKGSIFLKEVAAGKQVHKIFSPRDRSFMGEYEIEKEAHKLLGSKSSCPKWKKKDKRKIG